MNTDSPAFGDTRPAVNLELLLERLEQDHEVALMLMELFIQEHGEEGSRLEALLQQGQLQTAQQLVHTLKGVAGNLGAGPLQDCAVRLEAELRSGRLPAPTQLVEFHGRLQQTTDWFRNYLQHPVRR